MKIVLGKKTQQQAEQGQSGPGGMFGAKKAMPAADSSREDIISLSRRVKIIEERYTNLRGKVQLTEQNMLQKNKNFFSEIKALNVELTEVKKEVSEIKDRMMMLIKELDSFAKREHVEILKKYIDMWSPVKFATKNDVEDIVREVIDKMRREG